MKRSTLIVGGVLAALALAHSAAAQPSSRMEVSEIKPLLIRAIEQGSAHGVLVGESAAYVRQKFDTTAPVEIDVRALHALPQPGCSRLEVNTRQKGVLEHGKRADRDIAYQVSYCRDDHFPDKM